MLKEYLRLLSFVNRKIFKSEFMYSLPASLRGLVAFLIAPYVIILELYTLTIVFFVSIPIYIIKGFIYLIRISLEEVAPMFKKYK